VFVGAGIEKHFITEETPIACQNISVYNLERKSKVRV
jgi:hypothetical protein